MPDDRVFEHAQHSDVQRVLDDLKRRFPPGSRIRLVVPLRPHVQVESGGVTGADTLQRLFADPHFRNARVVMPLAFKKGRWQTALDNLLSKVPEAHRASVHLVYRDDFKGMDPRVAGFRLRQHFEA